MSIFKNKKIVALAVICCFFVFAFGACGKKEEKKTETPTSTNTPTATTTTAPTDSPAPTESADPATTEELPSPTPTPENHDGMVRSSLTGKWITEEAANKRPVACMISNVQVVDPQSGIGKADILYEAMNGGGVTRMMAVIEDYEDITRLGSIRSSRLYFIQWAMEWDPLFLHYGGPHIYVDATLNTKGVDNLDGCGNMEGTTFYRDTAIKSPHNAFASGAGVIKGANKKGYSLTHTSYWAGRHFLFAEDDSPNMLENGTDATYIEPGYKYNYPYLKYNEEDGLYYRFQFGAAHKDKTTGEQLCFKNVIIQICDCKVLDDENYLEFATISSGQSGYFITNGKCVPITWSKKSLFAPTKYYYADGTEIQLNTGKTMVCVVATSAKSKVVIK